MEQKTINEKQKISHIQRQVQLSRESKTRIEEKLKVFKSKIRSLSEDSAASETKKEKLMSEIEKMESELVEERRKIEHTAVEKRRLKYL